MHYNYDHLTIIVMGPYGVVKKNYDQMIKINPARKLFPLPDG